MGMLLRRHYPQKPVETEVVTYNDLTVKELRDIAKEREIEGYSTLSKEELIAVLEG
uniref:Rho termination factor, N-terminal domain n=1 Tax=Siphoviridae sp. ctCyS10 TaxID=2825382 RepID=A0A8S5U0N3_9CAUD|nr:MAG TPA: Rho termination factor, N-terminal domain [Siphoviridae sp. ctCyS10]